MTYSWQSIGTASFAPRDGLGLISYAGRLNLYGGWNPADQVNFPRRTNNEVWATSSALSPSSWSLLRKESPWGPRHTFGLVQHYDGFLYLIGSDTQQGYYTNDVWDSGNGHIFRRKCEEAPWGPRVLFLTASFLNKLWVFGGQTLPQWAVSPDEHYTDAWSSSDGGKTWTQEATSLPFLPRGMIDRLVVHDGYLWAIGGGCIATSTRPDRFLNDVWRSADGINWTQVTAAAPWSPRRYANVEVYDGKLWIVGGVALVGGVETNIADTWYSTDGLSWTEVASPWPARHAAGLAKHGASLFLVAGNNFQSDIWALQQEQPALGSSVALEALGTDVTVTPVNGVYSAARTGGADGYGKGARSTAALSGNYVWEIEPVSPDADFNLYIGTAASQPQTSWALGNLNGAAQVLTILSNRLDLWLNGSHVASRSWVGRIYGERIGTTLSIYSGPNWTLAKASGALQQMTVPGTDAWLCAFLRNPDASAKIRFVSAP